MKKYISLLLILACVMTLVGCGGRGEKHTIEILIPAGSSESFVYSDIEVHPTGRKITISAGAGISDTEVILKPVNDTLTPGYVAEYLTRGMPVEFDTAGVADEWFKIGVSIQNDSDKGPIAVAVIVEGVDVRIANNESITATEATVDWSEIPGGKRFIIEIRDRVEEEQLACAEAEELFYENETTEYYFNVIKSHYVVVTYNNGNSEDIVTALNAGRATIADLDQYGIEYIVKVKE